MPKDRVAHLRTAEPLANTSLPAAGIRMIRFINSTESVGPDRDAVHRLAAWARREVDRLTGIAGRSEQLAARLARRALFDDEHVSFVRG